MRKSKRYSHSVSRYQNNAKAEMIIKMSVIQPTETTGEWTVNTEWLQLPVIIGQTTFAYIDWYWHKQWPFVGGCRTEARRHTRAIFLVLRIPRTHAFHCILMITIWCLWAAEFLGYSQIRVLLLIDVHKRCGFYI